MRKIRLDLDALAVDSFAVSAESAPRGTVQGHGGRQSIDICEPLPHDYTEVDCTAAASCNGTCYASCGGGCGGWSGYYTCGGFSCREAYTCDPEPAPIDP
jgi:hypothetical protein